MEDGRWKGRWKGRPKAEIFFDKSTLIPDPERGPKKTVPNSGPKSNSVCDIIIVLWDVTRQEIK
jgi:hypothetical protein